MIDLGKKVPYLYQGDSSNPRQAWRMCFSSSCSMLAEAISPGCLSAHPACRGRQLDDFYRETLEGLRVGDTTEPAAQLATLRHFCPSHKFEYRQDCTWTTVRLRLQAGIPVPIGILHHGMVDSPSGGGHWICVVGWEGDDAGRVIVHDPAGELSVANGGYLDSSPSAGRSQRYSANGLGARWMVGGGATGWAILASKRATIQNITPKSK